LYYTIYKVTNKVNGKHYIGKHQTKDLDDSYMGSGKYLKHAIKKHGLENFTKEILFMFDTEAEMNAKEKELVIVSESTYNLCEGGKGGFGYINKNGLGCDIVSEKFQKRQKKFLRINKN
jgi:GIY-YIG catalytic domain